MIEIESQSENVNSSEPKTKGIKARKTVSEDNENLEKNTSGKGYKVIE